MKCIRIKFIIPNQFLLNFEKEKDILLKIPEGELNFKLDICKNDIYSSYVLKSEPLGQEVDLNTIKLIENALYLSFKKFDIGLLINSNLSSGGITKLGKKVFGENVESDFVGVKLVDCHSKYLELTASALGKISGEKFINVLNENIGQKTLIDEKLIRAIELYNSTNYLTRINSSGRFILLMSSIECLITQNENNQEIIKIIRETQERIRELELDEYVIGSAVDRLSFLRFESISRSGKNLVSELFSDSQEKFNGLNPVDFFSKAYDLRSKLVHSGKTETRELTIEKAQMQEFALSCLKKYCRKYYN